MTNNSIQLLNQRFHLPGLRRVSLHIDVTAQLSAHRLPFSTYQNSCPIVLGVSDLTSQGRLATYACCQSQSEPTSTRGPCLLVNIEGFAERPCQLCVRFLLFSFQDPHVVHHTFHPHFSESRYRARPKTTRQPRSTPFTVDRSSHHSFTRFKTSYQTYRSP